MTRAVSRINNILLLTFALLLASSVFGQVTGSLTGTVVDPQGGALAGARVSLFRPGGTEPVLQTLTSGEGVFVFSTISPESYILKIEKDGFGALEVPGLKVSPGVELPVRNLTLQIGKQTTSVESVDKAVSVQSTTAQVATTLSVEQLEGLPVFGRQPLDLVATQAGVSNNGRGSTTIDGLRVSLNDIALDGINIQDNFIRSNGLAYVPNRPYLGTISEFTLITSNSSAAYGNGTTHITAASPSGTNVLHGSIYALSSPNNLNASSWFENANEGKSTQMRNQGGFSLGGPIRKNKLLFYLNYEIVRERQGGQVDRIVLSPAARSGILYTSTGVPVNVLGTATIDPVIAGLLKRMPLPDLPYNPLSVLALYRFMFNNRTNQDNVLGKLDYLVSSKNSLTATYSWNHDFEDRPDQGVGYSPTPSVYNDDNRNFFSGAWRFSPSARWTNELRGGFNHAPATFTNSDQKAPFLVSFPSANGYYNASLNLGYNFNDLNPVNFTSNAGRTVTTYHLEDNASYVLGRHRIQFGFQEQWIRADTFTDNSVPILQIASDNQGRSSVDLTYLLTGTVAYTSQMFTLTSPTAGYAARPRKNNYQYDNLSFYIQDSWKFSRGLTLTAGLRYEYFRPLKDDSSLFFQPAISGGFYPSILQPNVYQFGAPNGLYNSDHNNFAPNIGLAWDPFGKGKTVFRAAYGLSYVNDDTIIRLSRTLNRNGGIEEIAYSLANVGATPSNPPAAVTPPAVPASYTAAATYTTAGLRIPYMDNASVPDPNLKTPYVQQWSAGIQQEIKGNLIDVRYVGNHATGMLREVNLVNSSGLGTVLGNFSSSSYNALQADVSRRFRTGLRGQVNYTWSKVLSDVSRETFDILPYRDTNNPRVDRARAAFDIPHAFKANFICTFPECIHQTDNIPLRWLLGGWSISGILSWQAGAPYSILANVAAPNSDLNPALNTASTTLSGEQLNQAVPFFINGNGPSVISNAAAFAAPAARTPGNLAYNRFSGPTSFDLNLGIQKQFRITESQKLQFRFEAINALNHPTFVVFDQTLGTAGFGQNISTLNPPRSVQLSLYYRF